MSTLILLRHGKSDWAGGEPDHLRPLARRGRRQVHDPGRWLADNVGVIDLAVVSPAERTRETWRLRLPSSPYLRRSKRTSRVRQLRRRSSASCGSCPTRWGPSSWWATTPVSRTWWQA